MSLLDLEYEYVVNLLHDNVEVIVNNADNLTASLSSTNYTFQDTNSCYHVRILV